MLKVIQSPANISCGPDAAMLFGEYCKNLPTAFLLSPMTPCDEVGGRQSIERPA